MKFFLVISFLFLFLCTSTCSGDLTEFFPLEILFHVLDYSDQQSCASCRQTSKDNNQIVLAWCGFLKTDKFKKKYDALLQQNQKISPTFPEKLFSYYVLQRSIVTNELPLGDFEIRAFQGIPKRFREYYENLHRDKDKSSLIKDYRNICFYVLFCKKAEERQDAKAIQKLIEQGMYGIFFFSDYLLNETIQTRIEEIKKVIIEQFSWIDEKQNQLFLEKFLQQEMKDYLGCFCRCVIAKWKYQNFRRDNKMFKIMVDLLAENKECYELYYLAKDLIDTVLKANPQAVKYFESIIKVLVENKKCYQLYDLAKDLIDTEFDKKII